MFVASEIENKISKTLEKLPNTKDTTESESLESSATSSKKELDLNTWREHADEFKLPKTLGELEKLVRYLY